MGRNTWRITSSRMNTTSRVNQVMRIVVVLTPLLIVVLST
jgi:hypothetical protein